VASTTSSAATGNFNSCSVVTRAEAASAIGESVTPGVLGNATVEGGLACVFYGPSAPSPATPNAAQPDSVRVVVVEGSHALTWYDDYKSKVHAQPISGFGDRAYYDGYASLSVLKGDHYLPDRGGPSSRSAVPVRRGEARHRDPAEVVVRHGPGGARLSCAFVRRSNDVGRAPVIRRRGHSRPGRFAPLVPFLRGVGPPGGSGCAATVAKSGQRGSD
jgi:hypothetical protein